MRTHRFIAFSWAKQFVFPVACLTVVWPAPHPALQSSKHDLTDIRFGMVAAINGDLKPWGEESEKGAKLAIDEFNSSGGVHGRKVKLFIEDCDSIPEEAKTAAKKLVTEDKVIVLLGEVASGLTTRMGQIASRYRVPLISEGSTRPYLNVGHPYMFRICYTDAIQGPVMAKFAYEVLKLRRIALMTDKTQAYSVSLSDGFRKEFTAVGGKIVTEQFYSTGGTDFKAQIVAIKAKKPSGIFMSGYFNEAGPIARQVADAGLKVRMMGGDGWESSQTLISGGDAILGSYYCTPYNNKENRPEVKKFLAKWTKKYGGEIPETSMAALAYDATTVACDALKRANSQDSAGMRVAIENTIGFDGVTGTITLKRKHGNPPKRALVVKLTKDGPVFVKAYEPEAVTGR